MSDNRDLDGALKTMYQKHDVIELTLAQANAVLCELERLWEIEAAQEPTPAEKWLDGYREVIR